MMQGLLIGKHSVVEPLGMMYVGAIAKQMGHSVAYSLIDDPEKTGLFDRGFDWIGASILTGFHKQLFSVLDHFDCTKIIGGPHATFFSEECLKYADYVVVGEAFVSFRAI